VIPRSIAVKTLQLRIDVEKSSSHHLSQVEIASDNKMAPRSDIERVTSESAAIQTQLQSGRADYGAVSPNNY